ncbi:hypothetical protein [Algibacter sp. Ld11]|uniref:hypothetical protein n=1 Tax=Algibacter sp. Ld11 TaxID=649150 RepID=UPI0038642903
MNILIIPFHDWRKILKEGFRTRDAHFIEVLSQRKELTKVIINRPITFAEIFVKKKQKLIDGKVVLQKNGFTLYEIQYNTFVIDYISKSIFKQIIEKYRWYIDAYSTKEYVEFIQESLTLLKIKDYNLLSQNVFAYKLAEKLEPTISVFDAWDNFTKFKVYKPILDYIEEGYTSYGNNSDFWITNARENLSFFSNGYHPKNIYLIQNGVDLRRFVNNQDNNNVPVDLAKVKRPIIGFGGKITQLLDVDLINNIVKDTPKISFVFVGQILDKDVFSRLKKAPNFHYLGDKHYDAYPNYVKNFDICIVPYVTKEEQKSGANSIKVYEYLATGKKVIGTLGNGLEELGEYLYLINNVTEFKTELEQTKNEKPRIDLNHHSWKHKVDCLIELIEDERNS